MILEIVWASEIERRAAADARYFLRMPVSVFPSCWMAAFAAGVL
jgi:hypothetical protein